MAFSLRNVFKKSPKKDRASEIRKNLRAKKAAEADAGAEDTGAGEAADPVAEEPAGEAIEEFEELSEDDMDRVLMEDGEAEKPGDVAEVPELEPSGEEPAMEAAASEGLLEAIRDVGGRVDDRSREVQQTVRDVSSEQNSVIQGIYRLINERTMDRSSLNKRRREVWQALSESLSDIKDGLGDLQDGVNEIRDRTAQPRGPGPLEGLLAELRSESRSSAERVERALGDLRDAQWRRIEEMITELRDAERERVGEVLASLKEEGERRFAEAERAGEARVFDAIRTGDERVASQKEILREKVADLETIYQERSAHLESVLNKRIDTLRETQERDAQERAERRRKSCLQLVSLVDNLEHRLRLAQADLAARERSRVTDPGDMSESQERRVSFVRRFLGKRDYERFEAERLNLESRLVQLDGEVLDAHRARVDSLQDLRGLMLINLKYEGVEPFSSYGETFDPARHVRVEDVPAKPTQVPGTVLGVRRSGYLLDGEVLRPAEVVVASQA